MANKELTQEEIQKLFKFVKSKYVHFIDVQHEIVDHLASAIEEKQNDDPNLSFDTALRQVYSGFPITGFANIIEEKAMALKKYWMKKFFGYMLTYFKLPKILILGSLVYLFHFLFQSDSLQIMWYIYFICVLLSIIGFIYRKYIGFEFKKEFRENYLISETYISFYAGLSPILLYIPFYVFSTSFDNSIQFNINELQSWLLSFYASIFLLWSHAFHTEFPKMLQQEIKEKYSHLNIA